MYEKMHAKNKAKDSSKPSSGGNGPVSASKSKDAPPTVPKTEHQSNGESAAVRV